MRLRPCRIPAPRIKPPGEEEDPQPVTDFASSAGLPGLRKSCQENIEEVCRVCSLYSACKEREPLSHLSAHGCWHYAVHDNSGMSLLQLKVREPDFNDITVPAEYRVIAALRQEHTCINCRRVL